MARKLRCNVTKNWSYCSDERYQKLVEKFGGEEELTAKYVSREGKKLQETGEKAPKDFKNKIACTVTGELCYISDARMAKLVEKLGSEDEVRKQYLSRVAKRLMKEGKTKTEIRQMVKDGTLPTPTGAKNADPAPATGDGKAPEGDKVIDNAAQHADPVEEPAAVAAKKSAKKKSAKKKSA